MYLIPESRVPSIPFATDLAHFGNAIAISTAETELTYAELSVRVSEAAQRLGDGRKLVMLRASNSIGSIVGYLAALSAGHAVLLVPGDSESSCASMLSSYDPDVVVESRGLDVNIARFRDDSVHELHPDLALLLSTSGSTGSPKLVRLSHDNLQSNADAIAKYLSIGASDRAITSLPMHYCYGLSVINSHLVRGARIVLTDLSVVDECFWRLARDQGATSLAGVPYTFELLDRVGFDGVSLPNLRYVTQAGGRLAPEMVRRYAALGRRDNWDFYVMYGQTEATARMAYLPSALAAERPTAIGVPIPGGSFDLEPCPESHDPEVGELVYRGPNVMLGYAEAPRDLALGRTVEELRTGDLARRADDGLYEVTGRMSRFVKQFGVRIDLDRAEVTLAMHGLNTCCVGIDEQLVVVVGERDDATRVRSVAAAELGVPATALQIFWLAQLPRLSSGKIDYSVVIEAVASGAAVDLGGRCALASSSPGSAGRVRALFAEIFDLDTVANDDTFVGLGGDSLSYVEMSVALEETLGHLPAAWHTTPVGELEAAAVTDGKHLRGTAVESSVLLRAVAIVLIVGSHTGLFTVLGSAHALVAVAGFNFARFMLGPGNSFARLRRQTKSVARIVLPSCAWIAFAAIFLTDHYSVENVFLLNGILGPEQWSHQWNFWFVESLVYVLVACCSLVAVPWIGRTEQRQPFAFACAVLAMGLVTRFGVVEFGLPNTMPVLWLFALGWATARNQNWWQRAIVTVVTFASVPGFFGDPAREAVIAGGLLLLIWLPYLRVPAAASRVAAVLASGSLYIYLTHWQIFPHFDSPLIGVSVSLAVGVAYWRGVIAVPSAMGRLRCWTRKVADRVSVASAPREAADGIAHQAHR